MSETSEIKATLGEVKTLAEETKSQAEAAKKVAEEAKTAAQAVASVSAYESVIERERREYKEKVEREAKAGKDVA